MTDKSPVPFLDLVTMHHELESSLLQVAQNAFRTAGFIGGPVVSGFEKAFAEFCKAQSCVGVGSGTDALRFALIAAGVGAGDAVVTVPNTFIATTEAISQVGAVPEFVDVDERTYSMDPAKLAEYLEQKCSRDASGRLISRRTGKRIAAVLPVHLFGQMADMDPIVALAEQHNLIVIEDACQAHGAEYFSKKQNRWCTAGMLGRAAAFSFYPGKNLGACGEAGAVVTNDEKLAATMRMLRDHGQARKYYHDIEGYNGRLDAMQAGFLGVKLPYLAGWNSGRRQAAARYRELFNGCAEVILPYEPEWARPVYHLFVVRVQDRDGLMKHLAAENIGTGIHYPVPLHLQKAYAHLNYAQGDFPVAEKVTREIVSLPMFPHLKPEQQARVADSVIRFTRGQQAVRVASAE